MTPEQKAALVHDLRVMPGWKIVEEFLESKLRYHRSQLESCSADNLKEHQTIIKAYKAINVHLDTILLEGTKEVDE